jgi:hypothetical protein
MGDDALWVEAALLISRISGVRAWLGHEEQEAAIQQAFEQSPDDPNVKLAAGVLRSWPCCTPPSTTSLSRPLGE